MHINQILLKIRTVFYKPKPIIEYETDPYEQSRNWVLQYSKQPNKWWYRINNIVLPEIVIKNANSFIDLMKKENLDLNSSVTVYSNGECVLYWHNEIYLASIAFLPDGSLCIKYNKDTNNPNSNPYAIKVYELPNEEFNRFLKVITKKFSIIKEQEVKVI